MIKVGRSIVNESVGEFNKDISKEVSKFLGISLKDATYVRELGKTSKEFDKLYKQIDKMKPIKTAHVNSDRPDRATVELYKVDSTLVVYVDQEGDLTIVYKKEDDEKLNESVGEFNKDISKEVVKLLGSDLNKAVVLEEFGKTSKAFDKLYKQIDRMKPSKIAYVNSDQPDRATVELYTINSAKVVYVCQEGLLHIVYKKEDDTKLNESVSNEDASEMNESLKPMKCGWYGNSNPTLPDGTPELGGANKAIEVYVIPGDAKDQYAVVALMGEEGEHFLQRDGFSNKKDAVKLAELLLKEVKDPMYDAKLVAKKYKMDYSLQESVESTGSKMNEAVHPFVKSVDKIVDMIDSLEVPNDKDDVKNSITQLERIKKAADAWIKDLK